MLSPVFQDRFVPFYRHLCKLIRFDLFGCFAENLRCKTVKEIEFYFAYFIAVVAFTKMQFYLSRILTTYFYLLLRKSVTKC